MIVPILITASVLGLLYSTRQSGGPALRTIVTPNPFGLPDYVTDEAGNRTYVDGCVSDPGVRVGDRTNYSSRDGRWGSTVLVTFVDPERQLATVMLERSVSPELPRAGSMFVAFLGCELRL
jgi:hypothetical protein